MKAEATHFGQCLCGSVRVTAQPKTNHFGACHCNVCRKWSGGPLLAVECENRVTFEGESHIGTYASSEWAERGFCKCCGTHLFYRLKEKSFYAIPVGLFDDDRPWKFTHQIFIDRKPSYYSFTNATQNMTGAEVFAQFSDETSYPGAGGRAIEL
jgi:hypothetical protein